MDIYYILTILIGSFGLVYTIFYNASPLVKHKIIFDIFYEIGKTAELRKLIGNKVIYVLIYFIGLLIFPFLHIIHIISILLYIIILSAVIILIIELYQNHYNTKIKNSQHDNITKEIKILNYKVGFVLFHVYILLFIFILVAFIEFIPYIAFLSIPLLLFYLSRYFPEIIISLYAVILIDGSLFMFAVRDKYNNINDILIKSNEKLRIKIELKSGGKIIGDLYYLGVNFLTLIDFENIIYNIKYKQIEIIGCKYYP